MTDLLLQRSRLEQTCRACGRWEAAGFFCSWCGSATGPADWYRNDDAEQREARMPKTAPAVPPSEYLSERDWPKAWGRFPRQKPLRQSHTPETAADSPNPAYPATPVN
jgi:hypothetical protein